MGCIANSLVALEFAGRELFSYIDAVAQAGVDDVLGRLEVQLKPQYSSLSVVRPKQPAP